VGSSVEAAAELNGWLHGMSKKKNENNKNGREKKVY
jgi:hypothetical protein